ncbi:MAG: 2'-5' RNA ligase family protein [Nocardioides sp.]|uniref:2'-5' RNA ligase family protein n=1 Tax=Nocardioides sp. TaxID=35761 RepID=UPI00326412EC
MPDFALELSFDTASEAAVVAQWEALRAAGLPSQADHKSMTNAPHLTLVAAQELEPELADVATATVPLPSTLVVRGLVLFGMGTRVTVAHLVEPDSTLSVATSGLRERVPDVRHPVWTPHVTLARRVPRSRLAELLEVLGAHPSPTSVTCTRLRWWDPVTGEIEELAQNV